MRGFLLMNKLTGQMIPAFLTRSHLTNKFWAFSSIFSSDEAPSEVNSAATSWRGSQRSMGQ